MPVLDFPVGNARLAVTVRGRELREVQRRSRHGDKLTYCLREDLIAATLGIVHYRVDLFLGRIGFYCNN